MKLSETLILTEAIVDIDNSNAKNIKRYIYNKINKSTTKVDITDLVGKLISIIKPSVLGVFKIYKQYNKKIYGVCSEAGNANEIDENKNINLHIMKNATIFLDHELAHIPVVIQQIVNGMYDGKLNNNKKHLIKNAKESYLNSIKPINNDRTNNVRYQLNPSELDQKLSTFISRFKNSKSTQKQFNTYEDFLYYLFKMAYSKNMVKSINKTEKELDDETKEEMRKETFNKSNKSIKRKKYIITRLAREGIDIRKLIKGRII